MIMCIAMLAGCSSQTAAVNIDTKEVSENTVTAASGNFTDEMKIDNSNDTDENGGADFNERTGDHKESPYFNKVDFYNAKSDDTRTILTNYKTYQQTNEFSCGICASLMAFDHYGMLGDKTEAGLSEKYKAGFDGSGTNLRQMKEIFEGEGLKTYSTFDIIDNIKEHSDYFTYFNKDMIIENLKNNKPVLVCWNDWGGHWESIIGYDTMGTDDEKDDVLIIADSYDCTDHNQDGYGVIPYQRFLYNFSAYTFFPEEELNDFLFIVPSEN
ncbi:MAG: hypothetical protein IJ583_09485 [Firmicutes bacterium]|nr:hypothetical protein [Bacillota bacterium]